MHNTERTREKTGNDTEDKKLLKKGTGNEALETGQMFKTEDKKKLKRICSALKHT